MNWDLCITVRRMEGLLSDVSEIDIIFAWNLHNLLYVIIWKMEKRNDNY